jgi:hypothetical protein
MDLDESTEPTESTKSTKSNESTVSEKSTNSEKSDVKVENERLSEFKDASTDATNVILAAGTGVAVSLSATGVGLGMSVTVLALTVVVTQIYSVVEQNSKLIEFMPSLFLAVNSLHAGMSMNGIKAHEILNFKINNIFFYTQNKNIIDLLETQMQSFIKNTVSLSIALLCAMPKDIFENLFGIVQGSNCIFYKKIFNEVQFRKETFLHEEFFTFIRAFSASDLSTTFQKQLLIIQSNVTTISLLLEEIEMLLSKDDTLYQEYKDYVKNNTKTEIEKLATLSDKSNDRSSKSSKSNESIESEKKLDESTTSLKGDYVTNETSADEPFFIYGFSVSFEHDEVRTNVQNKIDKLKEHARNFEEMSTKLATDAAKCLNTITGTCNSVTNDVSKIVSPELHLFSLLPGLVELTLSQMYPIKGGRRKKFQTKKRNKNRKTKHKRDVINNRKHTRFTKHNRFTKRN